MEAILEKFRQVCRERTRMAIHAFGDIGKNPGDVKLIDAFMREIHTLKGELRLMSFADEAALVHGLEDVLKLLKQREFAQAAEHHELVCDVLDAVLDSVVKGRRPDVAGLTGKLDEQKSRLAGPTPAPPGTAAAPLPVAVPVPVPGPGPGPAEAASTASLPQAPPAPAAGGPGERADAPEDGAQPLSGIVRVERKKIDQLGQMVGDLFTSFIQLQQFSTGFESVLGYVRKNRVDGAQASQALSRLQYVTRKLVDLKRGFGDHLLGIQTEIEQVLHLLHDIRLLPLSVLFEPYENEVRGLAREKGKKIRVEIHGGTILVDRSVIDTFNDILIHLVRNAVDHGIEYPSERLPRGKPEQGRITLTARQVGDRILLDVADDGKGMDPAEIKKAAVQKGFLTAEQSETLSPQELLELTFLPGFSTMDHATELSGRGVGLDVVRTRIQEFSGNLHLTSAPGMGTCFTIELPTTIAISRVVVFRVGRQRFAVLNTFINRLLRLTPDAIISTSSGPVMDLDGQTVPVQDAADLLNVERAGGLSAKTPTLIIEQGGKRLALQVDELLGEQELTIKPLSSFLAGTHGVSGAAIQRDGTMVLLLHVGDLLSMGRRRLAKRPARPAAKGHHISRVLLVEDSMVIREIERSLLSSLGLEVEEAEDGAQALSKLDAGGFDLVVSDVDMPNLNGLELTQRIRQSDRWSKVPIILVTTRDTPEDRQRGMECGADAYIAKSEFKHGNFIEVVRRFMR